MHEGKLKSIAEILKDFLIADYKASIVSENDLTEVETENISLLRKSKISRVWLLHFYRDCTQGYSFEAEVLKITLSTSYGDQLWLFLNVSYFSFFSCHNFVLPNGSGRIRLS